jgi:hypothetical protein
VHAFGDIEHQVPAPAGNQCGSQLAAVADAFGAVSQGPDGRFDSGDGVVAVELGRLFFRKTFGQVLRSEGRKSVRLSWSSVISPQWVQRPLEWSSLENLVKKHRGRAPRRAHRPIVTLVF